MKDTEDKYLRAIVDNFINLMKQKGIEVADIAAASNLDRKQVYRFINRENVPELTTFIKIILGSGIELKEVFEFEFDFINYMKEKGITKINHDTK